MSTQERKAELERERMAARDAGQPYAVPFDLGVQWDSGAPAPVLISAWKTILTFYRQDTGPWDGTPRLRQDDDFGLAVLRFSAMTAVKIGSPNDEVLHGHPLYGSGLDFYEAHQVLNSPWIEELRMINSVHRGYKDENWFDRKHYLFAFHDETFECVTSGSIDVQVEYRTLPEILPELVREAVG